MKIDLRDLSKPFSGKQVLNNIDLCIKSGSSTTLLGPSGCGKTTPPRMIVGLETPDQGDIYFDDICVFSSFGGISFLPERRGLGFVFQDSVLWPHMTVLEDVAFRLRAKGKVQGLDQQARGAPEAIQLEGLERRYPH